MKLKLWKYKELDRSLSEGRHSPSLLQEVVELETTAMGLMFTITGLILCSGGGAHAWVYKCACVCERVFEG